jgi:nucleoside-diphosphate-sugar epimerase
LTVKVFIAGATGALGLPTTKALLAAGHDVVGLTRRREKVDVLEDLGARAVVGDVLDEDVVRAAIGEYRPDAVANLLTALPARGPVKFSDLDATNEVRTTGTKHLVRASIESGVRRMVAESIVLVYGYGASDGELKTEESTVVIASLPKAAGAIDAVLDLERQTLEAGHGIEGIVLRYGLFYGPDAGSTKFMMKMVQKRLLPLPGGGPGAISWIHMDDAATATVAALERGRPGEIYNVVDDEPVAFGTYVRELADVLGAPDPINVPAALAKVGNTYASAALQTNLKVSNAKAKKELGWEPRYPTYKEGLRSLVSASSTSDAR